MKLTSVLIKLQESERIFKFRENSVGDKGVMKQIFQNKDYSINHWQQGKKLLEYHSKQSKTLPSLIIDAGANIGASAVYFSNIFSNAFIFSVEPDIYNWELLNINTYELNIFNFNGALANFDGELVFEDPGRSDWGFMTRCITELDENPKKIKCISPSTILSHEESKNTNPLILKIDIEGGEDALFNGNTVWLDKFPLVIIELHDWMLPFSGSSRNFIKSVAQYDFDFLYRGENIFLFNRKILNL
jgi:FkbM family methyltransferase